MCYLGTDAQESSEGERYSPTSTYWSFLGLFELFALFSSDPLCLKYLHHQKHDQIQTPHKGLGVYFAANGPSHGKIEQYWCRERDEVEAVKRHEPHEPANTIEPDAPELTPEAHGMREEEKGQNCNNELWQVIAVVAPLCVSNCERRASSYGRQKGRCISIT
jgi:hypothetical protein